MKKILIAIICFYFFFSTVGAQTWSALKRLTWNSGLSEFPSITADSGNGIHVVWDDDTPGNEEIFYKGSTDGGASWAALKRLTWNSGRSLAPAIATDSRNGIHIVWHDETPSIYCEIFYKSSTNGVAWSALKRLTWNAGGSLFPSIAIDTTDQIHIVWRDSTPGNEEIFYKRSTDVGVTWSAVKRLTWNAGQAWKPKIAIDSNNVIHVVWDDNSPGNWEIFYKSSTDGGTSWSAPKRLTWNAGSSVATTIAADSGNGIHIAWEDNSPGNEEIFYKCSTDSGASWAALKRLTWNRDVSGSPTIATDSGNKIHILYCDQSPGNYEIFYRRSADVGVTWSAPKRLTWNSGSSLTPCAAADPGNGIHIVWDDGTPGNSEIFYKNRK